MRRVRKSMNQINVVPYIDVMLVLLVIFMVTAPLVNPGEIELPSVGSRLIHYFGTDAKLRVFRYERWIPGKWMELHKLYMKITSSTSITSM